MVPIPTFTCVHAPRCEREQRGKSKVNGNLGEEIIIPLLIPPSSPVRSHFLPPEDIIFFNRFVPLEVAAGFRLMAPLLLCCLISGSGTNLQAIIDAISSGVIPDAKICLVISNKKHAFGLERAKSANIPTEYLNLIPYGKKNPSSDPSVKYSPEARKAYDEELAKLVLRAEPNVIVCAGWLASFQPFSSFVSQDCGSKLNLLEVWMLTFELT